MNNAIFYGVSVGPGDPELITLQALRILRECSVIAAPQTQNGRTLALDVVRKVLNLSEKTIVYLPTGMTRDKSVLQKEHADNASRLLPFLKNNQNVAMLTLGDVSVYSTVQYIAQFVKGAGFKTIMLPGVTSFCACAATVGQSLTSMNEPLHIFPAGVTDLDEALSLKGSKILMKSGRSLPDTVHSVLRNKKEKGAALVLNCGLPEEIVYSDLHAYQGETSYFATIILPE